MIQVYNLYSGEMYMLSDGTIVEYNGFNPKHGHSVIVNGETHWLPHGTKFYIE